MADRFGFRVCVIAVALAGCSRASTKEQPESTDQTNRVVLVDRQATAAVKIVKEKEPNNDAASATVVAIGSLVRGNLDGDTDVDHYKLRVPKPGLLSLQVTGIDKVDVIVELRDSRGKRLARSDRGPANTLEGVPNFPVHKGDYYVVVSEFVKKQPKKRRRPKKRRGRKGKRAAKTQKREPVRTGPSPNYELSTRLIDSSASSPVAASGDTVTEKEPNDKVATAIELKQGAQGVGYIGWSKDKDVWKLMLDDVSGKDVIDVDVTGISGVRLVLEMLDVDGKRLLRRWGAQAKSVAVRGLRPAAGHEAHHVRLFAQRSQPAESYTVRFSVRKPDPADEVEPNDAIKTATPLADGSKGGPPQTGGLRRGYLTRGDVDYYKLDKRTEPIAISVSVTPPADVDIVLFVMDGKGGVLAKMDVNKKGGAESTSKVRIPANTEAVIKVSGNGSSSQPERYELRWSVEAVDASAAPPPVKSPGPEPAKAGAAKKKSNALEEYDD